MMLELNTRGLAVVIRERQALIRNDARCVGCRTTAAECEKLREGNTDPTAPAWMGCCAMGMTFRPCSHREDPGAADALLDEIAVGKVRTVAEILAERKTRRAWDELARGPLTGPIHDQGEWWRKRDGSFVRIAEMSPGHRYNAAAMLMRGAPVAALKYAMQFRLRILAPDECGEMTADSLDRECDEVDRLTDDPVAWLRQTALYRALTEGLTVWGAGTESHQSTGRDPVTGKKVKVTNAPVCMVPACGCSGTAHA